MCERDRHVESDEGRQREGKRDGKREGKRDGERERQISFPTRSQVRLCHSRLDEVMSIDEART